MSTRATIQVKDNDSTIYLYRHCDGCPSVCAVDLWQVLEKHECWCDEDIATDIVQKKDPEFNDFSFWVASCEHGDEEFKYVIDCRKKTFQIFEKDYAKDKEWVDITKQCFDEMKELKQ